MEQSIEGQQLMAEGPKAPAASAGGAGGQPDTQPAMGQQPQGGCDCEESASNPQPQMTGPSEAGGVPQGEYMPGGSMNPQMNQPAAQAMGTGQPMAAPGQQTVGMNPQMGVTMGQPSALGAAAQAYGASPVTQNPGVMPGAGMNPQMSQPAAQAMGIGQQQAVYDPSQYAAWQAWYQQQAAQAANAAAIASRAAAANSGPRHPKYDAHKYGQMIDTVGRFLNGEANVGEVVDGLFSLNFQDDQFWKGAVVGAVAALLLTSETVQSGLAKTVGTIFATAQSGVEKVTKTYKEATEEVKKEKK